MPKMIQPVSHIGETLTCCETGKQFIGAADGISTNYATDASGKIYSDEGVAIREARDLLDRSKPFYAYVSSDGKSITGWKGNILGAITGASRIRLTRLSYTHGKYINHYIVRDVHGGMWYGKGSPSIAIKLRAYKGKS